MSAPTTTAAATAAAAAAAAVPVAVAVATVSSADARIGELRQQIDSCDAEIIRLVQQRLAVSREIGALRTAAGGTRLSLSREQQVLSRFSSELGPDGAALAMMLLRQGRGRL